MPFQLRACGCHPRRDTGGSAPREPDQSRLCPRIAFCSEFRHGGIDAGPGEVVDVQAPHDLRSRFRKEAAVAQWVDSFWTARVVDTDAEADLPYLVSGLINGR